MIVHTLISPYRLANSYLVEFEDGVFVGIDIGNIDLVEITSVIEAKNGNLAAYFLTHAHGDHTVGIKAMYELYKMPIYCSESAAADINNPRKNFSIYSEVISSFKYSLPFYSVVDGDDIDFGIHKFQIMTTPGHSPGCIVISINSFVFTGDFAMRDYKTPLNLPNSSREDYLLSFEKFKLKFANCSCTYFPGHGSSFTKIREVF